MKLAALYSGGKDSTYSIYKVREMGHSVECLITMHPAADDSALFHYPNSWVTEYQAQAMQIPVLGFQVAGKSKEDETRALEEAIVQARALYNIDGVVFGGISSVFQKNAFEGICEKHGLQAVAPIWGVEAEKYYAELLDKKFEIMVVGVSAMGLEKEWLGRTIDNTALATLARLSKKYCFNLTFEGGEAETLVTGCPLFNKKLRVKSSNARWDGQRGIFEILEAELVGQ
ncbi:MAG: diphthine--ammonia ligase [Nitrososphaera sp.]|uniref:diphthine--ammonia ligase n=1 Tax=Nitrososphaera sp. TaxID=1971748 RepID=UPI003D6EF901